jgi:hypothetical protein
VVVENTDVLVRSVGFHVVSMSVVRTGLALRRPALGRDRSARVDCIHLDARTADGRPSGDGRRDPEM